MAPSGIITLLSDFGLRDAFVGIMKGVALGVCPSARLVDLTHAVPPQAVSLGALLLRSAVPYFPAGTVHLAVVDPGVGSARDAVVVTTARGFLVGPDNGLLAPAAALLRAQAIHRLTPTAYVPRPVSATFHGRDVFAPAAAHLAAGISPEALGEPVASLAPLALAEATVDATGGVRGEVVYVDHFGNLVTNIPAPALRAFRDSAVSVRIGGMSVAPLHRTYADVAPGALLALIDSWDVLEIAVRDGSAAQILRAGIGAPVHVTGG